MNEGLKRGYETPKPREAVNLPPEMRFFLGGVFEVGGSIIFNTDHNNGGSSYPTISIGDSSPILALRLSEELGGKPEPEPDRRTNTWKKKGWGAADIVLQLGGFAPSRRRAIESVREWVNAQTRVERVEIARRFIEEHSHRTTVSEGDYDSLVENPYFIAGVVEARGAIYSEGRKNPAFHLNTRNEALIQALIKKRGGHIGRLPVAGTVNIIYGKPYVLAVDRLSWQLGEEDSRLLVSDLKSYLLTGRVKGEFALRRS